MKTLRRYSPWLLTGILCACKIAGADIPLWLCLLPALLPFACVLALVGSLAAVGISFTIAYAVLAIYGAVAGKEYVS